LTVEGVSERSPLLLDHFLDQAIEVDVDVICDGEDVLVVGMMEHIEQAGVHSGDSACCLPPHSLSPELQGELSRQAEILAKALGVIGLMNVQFAVSEGQIFVLEANPRASRTVPFVAKAIGVPVAKLAARAMAGETLAQQGIELAGNRGYYAVKQPIFPFNKFAQSDPILGPEMRSTGESMGLDKTFGGAYLKALWGVGQALPDLGTVFVSVRDADKAGIIEVAGKLVAQGFNIIATSGTYGSLVAAGIACDRVNKVAEGRPHIVDKIKNNEVVLIINTTQGAQAVTDSFPIRRSALSKGLGVITTLAAAKAVCEAWEGSQQVTTTALQKISDN
jgi:carbamoyl-phosphate synthase large subunit